MKEPKIIQPTSEDYVYLGITPPEKPKTIVAPREDELRFYGRIDNSYGVPLRTRTAFADRNTGLFAPKEEDYQRLGIRRTPIVDETSKTAKVSSYFIDKNGFAYTGQKTDNLIDALAQSSLEEISQDGFISMTLLQHGMGLIIYDPRAIKLNGTKLGAKLFPNSENLIKQLDSGRKLVEGETSQGLTYRLVA
jgi:hypothetical protein